METIQQIYYWNKIYSNGSPIQLVTQTALKCKASKTHYSHSL